MKSQKRKNNNNLELKSRALKYSRKSLESKIETLAEAACATGDFAKDISRKLKSPVFFLANARSGTLLHYGIEDWKKQLSNVQRDEFAESLKKSRYWKSNKKRALFKTAGKWMKSGKLEWFVYSTRHIKVASWNQEKETRPVMKLPSNFNSLLEDKVSLVMGDISCREYPGSFSRGVGAFSKLPGFKEYIRNKKKGYGIIMASRRSERNIFSKLLEKKLEPKAYCFLLNPAKGDYGEFYQYASLYDFVNNEPLLIGSLGIKYGHGYENKDQPMVKVKTDRGNMLIHTYISRKVNERCAEMRSSRK